MSPRLGVIGLPGAWSTETLADAAAAATGQRLVIDAAELVADLETGAVTAGGRDLRTLDGVLVKKISAEYSPHVLDRLELLRLLEAAGVRVFSPAERILRLIDRLACSVTLRANGIPLPPTRVTESLHAAVAAVRDFGQAVFKPLYSTKARGMFVVAADEDEAVQRERIAAFRVEHPVLYIQRKLALPGRDLGLMFLGGEYLGAYARVSGDGAWNTTIHSGGRYEGHEPSDEIIDLARRAQAPFGMDFTTVDVAESELGPIVFEVSAFGGFRGAKEGLGLDVAERYVAYALERIGAGT